MLPNPQWMSVGSQEPYAFIHKDDGRLFWNAKVQQYLGAPRWTCLQYESELNWLSIKTGCDFSVVQDEDGNYYIEAKEALEECGFVFPLDEHLALEITPPENSHNRVIFQLESE